MNDDRQLQAAMWLMIVIQTIGAVDPISGPRKLPAPKVYVAVIVLFSILQLIADAGQKRAAAVMGWVTAGTAAFVNFKGTDSLLNFFNIVSALGERNNPNSGQGQTTA